jgi:hypothetical protein
MNSQLDAALRDHAVQELAAATAVLVTDHDVLGSVTNLLAGCQRCLRADGSGIVVRRPDDGRLEFLAATSHRAEDIELYQAQLDHGPAPDTIASGRPVLAEGAAFDRRWPELAEPFHTRGFRSVYAHPMQWRGQTLGAVNLFYAGESVPDGAEPVTRAFSDIATVVIMQSGAVRTTDVIAQLRTALTERIVIEQAKGVLAYTEDLTVDAAFERLLTLAAERHHTLSEVAAGIIAGVAGTAAKMPSATDEA